MGNTHAPAATPGAPPHARLNRLCDRCGTVSAWAFVALGVGIAVLVLTLTIGGIFNLPQPATRPFAQAGLALLVSGAVVAALATLTLMVASWFLPRADRQTAFPDPRPGERFGSVFRAPTPPGVIAFAAAVPTPLRLGWRYTALVLGVLAPPALLVFAVVLAFRGQFLDALKALAGIIPPLIILAIALDDAADRWELVTTDQGPALRIREISPIRRARWLDVPRSAFRRAIARKSAGDFWAVYVTHNNPERSRRAHTRLALLDATAYSRNQAHKLAACINRHMEEPQPAPQGPAPA